MVKQPHPIIVERWRITSLHNLQILSASCLCVCSLQVVLWSAIGPEGFYLFFFFYSAFLFLNANKDKTNSVLKSQLYEADGALLLLTNLSDVL